MFIRPIEFETVYGTKITVEATHIDAVEEFPSGICVISTANKLHLPVKEPYAAVLERIKNAPSAFKP